jgi:hypothetical protein
LSASLKKGATAQTEQEESDPNKGIRGDIEEEDVEESYYRYIKL